MNEKLLTFYEYYMFNTTNNVITTEYYCVSIYFQCHKFNAKITIIIKIRGFRSYFILNRSIIEN